MEKFMEVAKEILWQYGPKVIGAVVVLLIGLWIVKAIVNGLGRMMAKRNVDASLQPFLKSLVSALLKVVLVISILSMVGVAVTSFVAILGAAGLAVGLALSGTLQNFAGGVMILIFKPFKVGDVITAQGFTGSVKAIQIFNTILKSPDNKTIIIPNGGLSTGAMTNFSTEPTRRVDWTIGVGYGDDIAKAEGLIQGLVDADTRILKDPAAFIAVSELADSSVNFTVRAWVNAGDYWGVFFDMNKNVYNTFNAEGINIPFPQMDVHVHNN